MHPTQIALSFTTAPVLLTPFPYFIDKETKAQRGMISGPKSHSPGLAALRSNRGLADSCSSCAQLPSLMQLLFGRDGALWQSLLASPWLQAFGAALSHSLMQDTNADPRANLGQSICLFLLLW